VIFESVESDDRTCGRSPQTPTNVWFHHPRDCEGASFTFVDDKVNVSKSGVRGI